MFLASSKIAYIKKSKKKKQEDQKKGKKKPGFIKRLFGSFKEDKPQKRQEMEAQQVQNQAMQIENVQRDGAIVNEEMKENSSSENEMINPHTNIGEIAFNSITEHQQLIQEKLIICKECGAVLNIYSKVVDYVWNCEMCGETNQIKIQEQHYKQQLEKYDRLFVVENIKQEFEKKKKKEEDTIIFCVDNSGSMSEMVKLQDPKLIGHLKKHRERMLESQLKELDLIKAVMDEQEYQEQKQNIIYFSKKNPKELTRKQCVEIALESQMENYISQKINQKVGLVVFNNQIEIIGDGSKQSIVVAEEQTEDVDLINQITVNKIGQIMDISQGVIQTKDRIINKYNEQFANKQTALGPALLVSYNLLEGVDGNNQVILCTDGLANIGLGSLDTFGKFLEESEKFYEDLANKASQKGIQLNIVTMKGNGCSVNKLAVLAEKTGGTISRVDPDSMIQDINKICEDTIISKVAKLTIQLSSDLTFKNEDQKYIFGNKMIKELENITKKTEITFEYCLKDEAMQNPNKKYCFIQTRLELTFDNKKLLYVGTQSLEIQDESNLNQIQQRANVEILNKRMNQRVSELSAQQRFQEAEQYGQNWGHFLQQDNFNQKKEQKTMNMMNLGVCKNMRIGNKKKAIKSNNCEMMQMRNISDQEEFDEQLSDDGFETKLHQYKKGKF